MHEREEPIIFFKDLRLVAPKLAREKGVLAEAPVFMSPDLFRPGICDKCGVLYTPLVYQVGYEVVAQHFHPTPNYHNDGGIYFYALSQENFVLNQQLIPKLTGWVAILELVDEDSPFYRRALSVKVGEIRVYCRNLCKEPDGGYKRLNEGVVMSRGYGDHLLYPYCDFNCDPENTSQYMYRFKIIDGSVMFSRS